MAQYNLKKIFNYIKIKDIMQLCACVLVFPFAIIAKIFIRNFWLVAESRSEARDNGYWFFKWVRENKKKQKIAYAIDKKSADYNKVKKLGKIINYGTFSHWFWYIVADKNISSQKDGKPNAPVCYFFEVVLKLRKHNRIFLQHGITINNAKWLYYENCYFDKFICGAKPEYEYVKEKFGYPENKVVYYGFARYDNLLNPDIDKDLILIMPTWREWLGRPSKDNKNLDFKKTKYFKVWDEILNSEELNELLVRYNKKVLFFPHRNMQKFLGSFSTQSDRIIIADWRKYDIQKVLIKAGIMITDYSSVFFDFAYMRKPVIFYQFDEKEFREKQYQQGYFDYHNTPLGKWAGNKKQVLEKLESIISVDYKLLDKARLKEFFKYIDKKNSQRIYKGIIDE